jgi:hypothetical protein
MENAGQQARGGDAGLDAAFQIGVHIVSTQRKHLLVMFLWTAVLVWVGMTVVAGQTRRLTASRWRSGRIGPASVPR